MSQPTRKPADDPAIDAGGFLVRLGLAILAILVPVSVVLSRRALFTLVPVGASLVLIGGLLLPHLQLRQRLVGMIKARPALSGLALLAWCGLSLAWTPFPADAAARLAKSAGTVGLVALTIALLPERTRTSNIYLFPIGLAAAAIATGVTMFLAAEPFVTMQTGDATPERAALALVVLVWPSIGALAVRDRWITATLMAVLVAVAAMAAWTSVALAALAVGALTFVVATWDPVRVSRIMGGIVVLLFVLAPLLPFLLAGPFAALSVLAQGRIAPLADVGQSLRIWADIVAAEPLRLVTGHGFDIMAHAIASGFIPAPAPRSILFEAWYELGVVGAVVAALLGASAFAAVGRASPLVAPFLLAELAAALTVAFWGLDTTQLWWVTFLSVAAVAFVHVIRGQYKTERPIVADLKPKATVPAEV